MVLQGGSVPAALHPEESGRLSWRLLAVLGSCSRVFDAVGSSPERCGGAGLELSGRAVGWAQGWGQLSGAFPSSDPRAPPSHTALLCPLWLLQLVPKLSRNYLKEGYMEKTGPKVGPEAFFSPSKQQSCSVWPREGVAGGTNQPLPEGQSHNSVNVFNALSSSGSKHKKIQLCISNQMPLPGTAGADPGCVALMAQKPSVPSSPSPSGCSKCFETPGSCVVREKLCCSSVSSGIF